MDESNETYFDPRMLLCMLERRKRWWPSLRSVHSIKLQSEVVESSIVKQNILFQNQLLHFDIFVYLTVHGSAWLLFLLKERNNILTSSVNVLMYHQATTLDQDARALFEPFLPCDDVQLRKVYLRLALKYHPDKHPKAMAGSVARAMKDMWES